MSDTITLHAWDDDFECEMEMVVTDWNYRPHEPATRHEPGDPEEVEVVDGVVLRCFEDGHTEPSHADIGEMVEKHWYAVGLSLYSQARAHYDDAELEYQLDHLSN